MNNSTLSLSSFAVRTQGGKDKSLFQEILKNFIDSEEFDRNKRAVNFLGEGLAKIVIEFSGEDIPKETLKESLKDETLKKSLKDISEKTSSFERVDVSIRKMTDKEILFSIEKLGFYTFDEEQRIPIYFIENGKEKFYTMSDLDFSEGENEII